MSHITERREEVGMTEEKQEELSENMIWALREAYFVNRAHKHWTSSSARHPTLSALEKRGLIQYRAGRVEVLEPEVREITLLSGRTVKVKGRKKRVKHPARLRLTEAGVDLAIDLGPGRWRAPPRISSTRVEATCRALTGSSMPRSRLLLAAARRQAQAEIEYARGNHELGCKLEDEALLLTAHANS